jgi:hypothetical protein
MFCPKNLYFSICVKTKRKRKLATQYYTHMHTLKDVFIQCDQTCTEILPAITHGWPYTQLQSCHCI